MRILAATVATVVGAAFMSPAIAYLWLHPFAAVVGRWNPAVDALDFNVFSAAGWLVLHGQGAAIYSPATLGAVEQAHGLGLVGRTEALPYLNPAFFALLVAPLAALPFPVAFQVWTAVNLALVAALGWATWKVTAGTAAPVRAALVIAAITAMPVALTIHLGQFSLLLAVSWLAAYVLLRDGRDELAGLALAPLLIKPEMLLPLAFALAWRRQLRVFRTLGPAAAVAVVTSFAVVGLHAGLRYPGYLFDNATQHLPGTETQIMFGWNGILGSLLGMHNGAETLLAPPFMIVTVWLAIRCWKRREPSATGELAGPWLIVTMATVLADPHLYFQDLSLVVPAACAYAATRSGTGRRVAGVGLSVGWVILLMGLVPNRSLGINLFGMFLAAAFITLVVQAWRADRRTRAARRDPGQRHAMGEALQAA